MTIVDHGKTIPFNVNNYLAKRSEKQLDDSDAIRWAVQKGNTTKDITGGLGLSNLIEFLELNHGALQIVSGVGMLEYRNNEYTSHTLPESFEGTIVNMEFNFDDDTKYSLATELDFENLL